MADYTLLGDGEVICDLLNVDVDRKNKTLHFATATPVTAADHGRWIIRRNADRKIVAVALQAFTLAGDQQVWDAVVRP